MWTLIWWLFKRRLKLLSRAARYLEWFKTHTPHEKNSMSAKSYKDSQINFICMHLSKFWKNVICAKYNIDHSPPFMNKWGVCFWQNKQSSTVKHGVRSVMSFVSWLLHLTEGTVIGGRYWTFAKLFFSLFYVTAGARRWFTILTRNSWNYTKFTVFSIINRCNRYVAILVAWIKNIHVES